MTYTYIRLPCLFFNDNQAEIFWVLLKNKEKEFWVSENDLDLNMLGPKSIELYDSAER
jgi:hypothetical protein